MHEPFVLGVNYWPRRKAMYWWSDFEVDEVKEEFEIIASLGMSVVRIFLLWDDWQPTSTEVDSQRLKDLGHVCDIADSFGLGLDVTFFTGHMSGPNWVPQWLLSSNAPAPSPFVLQVISEGKISQQSYRNMFVDEEALTAEKILLETVVSEYKDHPAIWMWNLGNEPDLFAYPPSAEIGRAWVEDKVQTIKRIDAQHPVTCGLHVDSLIYDNHLHVDKIFAETDVAVMHGYPMYIPWAQNPLDDDFVPFTCALVTALSGKPCLAEEWGGCTNPHEDKSTTWRWTSYQEQERYQFMAGESDFSDYVGRVLPKLVDVGATGSVMWCYADYESSLWNKPPCDAKGAKHERHFGLVRPDGTLKPHAEVIRQFASTSPTVQPAKRSVSLDITADEFYQNPGYHSQRLYKAYLANSDSFDGNDLCDWTQ